MKKGLLVTLVACLLMTLLVVVGGASAETPSDVKMDCYQPELDGYGVRLVGSVTNHELYSEIGFTITVNGASQNFPVKSIFTDLLCGAYGAGGATTVDKSAPDGTHYFALAITNVPAEGVISMGVAPYAIKAEGGEVVTGDSVVVAKEANKTFGQGADAVIDFAAENANATENVSQDGVSYDALTADEATVSVLFQAHTHSTSPVYRPADGHIRVYGTAALKNQVVVSVGEGYVIDKIVLVSANSGWTMTAVHGAGTCTDNVWVKSAAVDTVTFQFMGTAQLTGVEVYVSRGTAHTCADGDDADTQCDVCFVCLEHADANTDYACDACGENLPHDCVDSPDKEEYRNGKCDICGEPVEHDHIADASDNCKCYCGLQLDHTHTSYPAKCDVCGYVDLDHTECADDNGDGACDGCGVEIGQIGGEIVFSSNEPNGTEVSASHNNTYEKNSIVITFKDGSTTTKWYGTGTEIRVYANGTMTVTAPAGYNLTKITISGANLTNLTANTGVYSSGTWTASTPVNAVTFTASARTDLKSLNVTVQAPCTEHTYGNGACDTTCDVCGYVQENAVAHTYANCADADCNVCGETRTAGVCVDNGNDDICDNCGGNMPEVVVSVVLGENVTAINGMVDGNAYVVGKAYNVTFTAAEGYVIASVESSVAGVVVDNGDGTYTITVPNEAFTLTVEAREAGAAPVVTTNADFSTIDQSSNTSYKTRTDTNGIWTATNAAYDKTNGGPILNGKTSAVGSLTSATLQGGISKLTFQYTNTYSETKGVHLKITITYAGGTIERELDDDSVTKGTLETVVFEDLNIAGDFTITITNMSPSNSGSNKDRVTVCNLSWDSYAG